MKPVFEAEPAVRWWDVVWGTGASRIRMLRWMSTGFWWAGWLVLLITGASWLGFVQGTYWSYALGFGIGARPWAETLAQVLAEAQGPLLLLLAFVAPSALAGWLSQSVVPFMGWAFLTVLLSIYDGFAEDAGPVDERLSEAVR